jgi:hypothetical protein
MSWEVPIEIARSPIHGTGVFAKTWIPKGTRVWKFDWSMQICSSPNDFELYDNEALDKALLGGFFHEPSGNFVWYRDGMDFVNHADTPFANIAAKGWTDLEEDANYATRDIEPGEELFEDYSFWNIFNLAPNHWLRRMYLQHCPQHYYFLQSLSEVRRAA